MGNCCTKGKERGKERKMVMTVPEKEKYTEEIKVHAVVPKQLVFILELTETQLKYLTDIADHTHIDYDGEKEPHMHDAVEFLEKTWYPFLRETQKTPTKG